MLIRQRFACLHVPLCKLGINAPGFRFPSFQPQGYNPLDAVQRRLVHLQPLHSKATLRSKITLLNICFPARSCAAHALTRHYFCVYVCVERYVFIDAAMCTVTSLGKVQTEPGHWPKVRCSRRSEIEFGHFSHQSVASLQDSKDENEEKTTFHILSGQQQHCGPH